MSEALRALFITDDPVGEEMGGNAIRAHELARVVSRHAEVTLAAPLRGSAPPPDVRHLSFEPSQPDALREPIRQADVVVTAPQSALVSSWLRRSRATLIFDLYDPRPFEMLAQRPEEQRLRSWAWNALALDQLLDALYLGNRFICASPRQRDLWLGAMMAARLISPRAYARDSSFASVIETVPFGVPGAPPRPLGEGGARARFPELPADAEIVLWNGGIWNWLDPQTAVRAAALLVERRPAARLVFMGRPSLEPAGRRAAEDARALAARLGVLNEVVLFNDVWVPYAGRADWLLGADCAVSTHLDHLETRFAFRTRLLDCFWAGLPVVCTSGDELAERVEREDLGATAPAGDADAVAAALEAVLARGRASYAEALSAAAADLSWPAVAEPLVRYVTAPTHPPRLGAGWARAASRPVQRMRAGGIRAARRLAGPLRRRAPRS